jgi:branched-chain amino acid transport system permease protein
MRNLEITGGPDGLVGIPSPVIFGVSFRAAPRYLLLVALGVAFTLFFTYRLVVSYHGRALRAIRDHETTAQVMGINTPAYKVAIFVLAAALAGLAGSLYAHYLKHINYESFDMHMSILIVCMVVLGGMGSLAGSILGAVILTAMPELFRQFKDYQDLAYGVLLVGLLIGRPQGLLGRGKMSLKFSTRKE